MLLAQRLDVIEDGLPSGWTEVKLTLTIDEPGRADRAAAILGSLQPGRDGTTFHLTVRPAVDGGPTLDATRRILSRLDEAGVDARLVRAGGPAAPAVAAPPAPGAVAPLALQWTELADRLPPDWSDALLELELASSADVERAALLAAPLNPLLLPGTRTFRVRAARTFGYGTAPQMVRRCLERLDGERVAGRLRLVRLLSDTRPVATQGPVWRVGGRSV